MYKVTDYLMKSEIFVCHGETNKELIFWRLYSANHEKYTQQNVTYGWWVRGTIVEHLVKVKTHGFKETGKLVMFKAGPV